MRNAFRYTKADKILFYLSYFFYKLILPLEVRSPRWLLWWYECRYTLAKFKDYTANVPWSYSIDIIKTKFGTFKIRPNTSDAANVSPAFERRDQNYLVRLIRKQIARNKKVLFLDIGGDLGSYSVLVANKFPSGVTVKCFEPIEESCRMIEENVALNRIKERVELYPVALLNENNDHAEMKLDSGTPGSSSMKHAAANSRTVAIKTRRLDDLLDDSVGEYDVVIAKIDVEGVEQQVIEGAAALLHRGKEVHVMVEDFIDQGIISYLQANSWSFCAKVTSYNSWWAFQK